MPSTEDALGLGFGACVTFYYFKRRLAQSLSSNHSKSLTSPEDAAGDETAKDEAVVENNPAVQEASSPAVVKRVVTLSVLSGWCSPGFEVERKENEKKAVAERALAASKLGSICTEVCACLCTEPWI